MIKFFTNPYFLYISALFLMNSVYSVTKFASINAITSVYQIIFAKTAIMALVVAPFNFKKLALLKMKDLHLFVIMTLLSTIETYVIHFSFVKLPIVNVSLISFIQPFVMLFAGVIFFQEKIPVKRIIGMILSLCAVLIAIDYKKGNTGNEIWYAIILLNTFVSSIAISLVKKLSQRYDVGLIVFTRVLGIAICSFALLDEFPKLNSSSEISILAMVVFVYIYERFIIVKTYASLDINKIQPLKFLNIVFSIILSYFIVGEMIIFDQAIATVMIMLAMYISYGNHTKIIRKIKFLFQ